MGQVEGQAVLAEVVAAQAHVELGGCGVERPGREGVEVHLVFTGAQHLDKCLAFGGPAANEDAGDDRPGFCLGGIDQFEVPALEVGCFFALAVVPGRVHRGAVEIAHRWPGLWAVLKALGQMDWVTA